MATQLKPVSHEPTLAGLIDRYDIAIHHANRVLSRMDCLECIHAEIEQMLAEYGLIRNPAIKEGSGK